MRGCILGRSMLRCRLPRRKSKRSTSCSITTASRSIGAWICPKPTSGLTLENENFGKWNYPLGVTLYGLLQTARLLGRQDVMDYVVRHVNECVKMYPYSLYDRQQFGFQSINHQLVEMSCLDDCGSFGAATLETYKECQSPEYRVVADVIADYILNRQVRTQDGAFYRVQDDVDRRPVHEHAVPGPVLQADGPARIH